MPFRNPFKKKLIKPIETKSVNTYNSFDFFTGNDYMNLNNDTSPTKLSQYNIGYVYACDSKLSQYVSSIPIHTYAYTANEKSMLTNHKLVGKSLSKDIKRKCKVSKKALDIVEITESNAINDFIDKPSTCMSYNSWIYLISSNLALYGNCLLEKVETEEGIKLDIVAWEYITVDIDMATGNVKSFRYSAPNELLKTYTPEQVVHITKYATGGNRYYNSTKIGKGHLEACLDEAQLNKWMNEFQKSVANNAGFPSAILELTYKNTLTEDEAKQAIDGVRRKYGGVKSGTPLVIATANGNGLNAKPWPGMSIKDADLDAARAQCRKVICSCFGIPEDLIETSNSNRASSIVAINSFYSITVFPWLALILEQLNDKFICVEYDDNAFIYFDKSENLSDDPVAQAGIYKTYKDMGVMGVNEIRLAIGLEAIDEVEVEVEDEDTIDINKESTNEG